MKLRASIPNTYNFCFLLLPGYSEMSLVLMQETLEKANSFLSDRKYNYLLVSESEAELGRRAGVNPLQELPGGYQFDAVAVIGDHRLPKESSRRLSRFLRSQYRQGAMLIGVGGGVAELARQGFLDARPASCHTDHIRYLADLYPAVIFNSNIFSAGGSVYSCAGGLATADMTLQLVEQLTPIAIERLYSALAIERHRGGTARQINLNENRYGGLGSILTDAIELMESNVDEVLELDEIAYHSGVSRRQLERLFRKHLAETPNRFYLKIRLQRARNKVLNSSAPIMDVAYSCGFVAPTHFTKCYKDLFGISPMQERMQINAAPMQ